MTDAHLPTAPPGADTETLASAALELLDAGEQLLGLLTPPPPGSPVITVPLATVLPHATAWRHASARLGHLLDATLHQTPEEP